jgi:hypothetical protein
MAVEISVVIITEVSLTPNPAVINESVIAAAEVLEITGAALFENPQAGDWFLESGDGWSFAE